MANFTDAVQKQIEGYRGVCNALAGEHEVYTPGQTWTAKDIFNLQEAYYNCDVYRESSPITYNSCIENRNLSIHLTYLPDRICWKSAGEDPNRVLADRIDDTCSSKALTGSDGEKKCDALEKVVDRYARESGWWTAAKVGGGIGGVWLVFGPGMSLWKKMGNGLSKLLGKAGPVGAAAVAVIGGAIAYSSEAEAATFPPSGQPKSEKPFLEKAGDFVGIVARELVCGLLFGCSEAH